MKTRDLLRQGREEGRAEGREEGRAEGREEGRAEMREEGIKALVVTLKDISQPLDLTIQKVAEQFAAAYQDDRISCFKYGRVRVNDGLGACRHPYVTTQVRMGEELAAYIRETLQGSAGKV